MTKVRETSGAVDGVPTTVARRHYGLGGPYTTPEQFDAAEEVVKQLLGTRELLLPQEQLLELLHFALAHNLDHYDVLASKAGIPPTVADEILDAAWVAKGFVRILAEEDEYVKIADDVLPGDNQVTLAADAISGSDTRGSPDFVSQIDAMKALDDAFIDEAHQTASIPTPPTVFDAPGGSC